MHGVIRTVTQVSGRVTGRVGACLLPVTVLLLLLSTSCFGADPANRLVAVEVEKGTPAPTILIRTAEPVGYRYTVYDSYDPVRVVVDFPGMDMAEVPEQLPVDQGVVDEVRVANFELSSGKLARVEILLTGSADYQVQLDETDFRLVFAGETTSAAAAPEVAKMNEKAVPTKSQGMADSSQASLTEVALSPGKAIISADSEIGQYKYFTLTQPPRLVVDLYGAQPAFEQRKFLAEGGMSQVRVGIYQEKTRFVFDAERETLPEHAVAREDADLIVTWTQGEADGSVAPAMDAKPAAADQAATAEESAAPPAQDQSLAAAPASEPAGSEASAPVAVEAVEFDNENGRSYVVINLSAPAETTGPIREGNLVRFGVKNATISRALRRTLDTFAFPTVIASVTPYTVAEKNRRDVRFAVELKGTTAYALEQDGTVIRLAVDDGVYAEAAPPEVDVVEVEAPVVDAPAAAAAESQLGVVDERSLTLPAENTRYTGEKISLVFDSADIRSILQLIGDVSDLNILASDDVQGSITLRLIDVPWDQALELILETADLGKIRQGNVLRIMPKNRIREMAQAELQTQKQEIEEAPLENRVFRISYSSVDDMKTVISDLLTERGNIIADARNKQLIVKDVPAVLDEMDTLISQIDQPEKQVMIEARIVEANTNFSRDLGVKWGFAYNNDEVGVGATGLDQANVGLGGAFLITPPAAGSVGSAGAAVGLSFGTVGVDTLTMDLRLSALESAGKGKIVSTPRVTTLNGEAATISQGTKIPYTTVSETGTETSFENAELKLEVTPEINPDGSVILEINASNSAVGTIVPTGTGNAVSIDEKKAETKVLVRDGETTVIGGIFVEDERDADSGVPFLKDLPLLGHLFKSTTKTRDRRELLIFITPRILD